MHLKVLCTIYGPDIDERIFQEPLKFQFCLMIPQSIQFPNRDIRPLAERPGKGKGKNKAAGSLMGILQDDDDYEK